jgi:hypothetical protein
MHDEHDLEPAFYRAHFVCGEQPTHVRTPFIFDRPQRTRHRLTAEEAVAAATNPVRVGDDAAHTDGWHLSWHTSPFDSQSARRVDRFTCEPYHHVKVESHRYGHDRSTQVKSSQVKSEFTGRTIRECKHSENGATAVV